MNRPIPDAVSRTQPLAVYSFPTAAEVLARSRAQSRGGGGGWLWHGYLKRGHITLLTSMWKSGKTTLVSILLSRLAAGGTLAGLAVQAGRVMVLAEESDDLWADRIERLGLGPNFRLLCRPFREQPSSDQWDVMIDSVLALREQEGLDLLVIDPLVHFLPGRSENDPIAMVQMLRTIRRLANAGTSVLILHHPRKAPSAPGRSARGTGALSGEVDIILEMDDLGRATETDRRRRLWAFSRHNESPRRLVIELNAEGTDYAGLGDFATNDFNDGWPVLHGVLEDAKQKLTRREISQQWPADFVKPEQSTLWRWLDQAVSAGRVLRSGTGRKSDPFRYWLDGMEEVWKSDPFYCEPPPPLEEMYGLRGPKKLAEVLAERQAAKDGLPKSRRPRRAGRTPGPASGGKGDGPGAAREPLPQTAVLPANPIAQLPAQGDAAGVNPPTAAPPVGAAANRIVVAVIRLGRDAHQWRTRAMKTVHLLDMIASAPKDGIGLRWDMDRSGRIDDGRAKLILVPRVARMTPENLTWLIGLARKQIPWIESMEVEYEDAPRSD